MIPPRPSAGARGEVVSVKDFEKVQRAVISGAGPDEVAALLGAGARLVRGASCPSCHCGYVAQLPDPGTQVICLACGLEFER